MIHNTPSPTTHVLRLCGDYRGGEIAPEQKLDVATGQSQPVPDSSNWLTDWLADLHN
jgi:hypothetical protein